MDSLVIVPTYNEAENILLLLQEIRKEAPNLHVLVVDDNSPDGTAKLVKEAQAKFPNLHLLNRVKKDGLALAYIAGFHWALEKGYGFIIQMDADFSHQPKSLPKFLERLEKYDVVVGSRYIEGGGTQGWSWIRQLISRGGNVYAKLILGLPFSDLTGGFNGWRAEVLKTIDLPSITARGYAFQVELKYRACRHGFQLVEQPILFENRRYGVSKMTGSIVWEAAIRVVQMRKFTPQPHSQISQSQL